MTHFDLEKWFSCDMGIKRHEQEPQMTCTRVSLLLDVQDLNRQHEVDRQALQALIWRHCGNIPNYDLMLCSFLR